MHPFSRPFPVLFILLFCLCSCFLVTGTCAADSSYTGYPGDVIGLHGYSCAGGKEVYLNDPGTRTGGSGSTSYALTPEDRVFARETASSPSAAAPVVTTPVPPSGTLRHPATPTLPLSTGASARATTKAAMEPLIAVIAVTCAAGLLISRTR